MPTKKIMVEVVNIPKNWSSLFNGKRLIQDPDMYDAKKSQNQIVWNDTLKASTSGYVGRDNVDHHNFIHELHLVKMYHFYDAYVCLTKDTDSYAFITRLKNLHIIFSETTYDLTMMDEKDFRDQSTQLHDAQKEKMEKPEEELVSVKADMEQTNKAWAQVTTKAMDNKIIIDIASTIVMDETPEASKPA